MINTTEWINAAQHPPIREGVYQVLYRNCKMMQHWNGRFWGLPSYGTNEAERNRSLRSARSPKCMKYRGLVKS